jgi:hypothetical protein
MSIHKTNKHGYSVIEILTVIAFIGIIFIMIVGVFGRCTASVSGADHKAAEVAAKQWSSQMGFKPVGISCTGIDSNEDGYVSCSIAVLKNDGTPSMIPIECAGSFTVNSGCRAARLLPLGNN